MGMTNLNDFIPIIDGSFQLDNYVFLRIDKNNDKGFEGKASLKSDQLYLTLLDGSRWHFKTKPSFNRCLGELISCYLADKLEIDVCHCYQVSLDNKLGIISEDFREPNFEYISLDKVISQHEEFSEPLNVSLKDAWMCIDLFLKTKNIDNKYCQSIMESIINTAILDMVCGNADRHPVNITLAYNQNEAKVVPNFDLEVTFVPSALWYHGFNRENSNGLMSLKDILGETDETQANYFTKKLGDLSEETFDEAIESIEQQYGHKYSDEIIASYRSTYCEQLEQLKADINCSKVK